jgi:histidyl-tRNA synthetase
MLISFANV